MAEYLSKETLQEKLNRKKAVPANKRYTEGWNDAVLMVKSMIHSEKAADVAPVRHGRWITKQEKDTFAGYLYSYECSECGRVEQCKEPYCNCGAKMDLED